MISFNKFAIVFLLINTACIYSSGIIYYNQPLTLVLLRDGVNSFLNKCEKISQQEFELVIKDTIRLSTQNKTDILQLLKDIAENLTSRIKRIELSKQKKIDLGMIAVGIVSIAIAAGMIYGVYKGYKKYFTAANIEYNLIKKELESKGIKISRDFHKIILTRPNSFTHFNHVRAERLAEILNDQNDIGGSLFCWLVMSVIPSYCGIAWMFDGFFPHFNEEFLETYRQQLIITKDLKNQLYFE